MRSPFSDKHISERSEKKGVNMERQIYSNEEEIILSKVEINKCTCVMVSAVPILYARHDRSGRIGGVVWQ